MARDVADRISKLEADLAAHAATPEMRQGLDRATAPRALRDTPEEYAGWLIANAIDGAAIEVSLALARVEQSLEQLLDAPALASGG